MRNFSLKDSFTTFNNLSIVNLSFDPGSNDENKQTINFNISNKKELEICSQNEVFIHKTEKKHEICPKDYFFMVKNNQTFDVVNKNSSHLESIQTSADLLYETALKSKIPLHKWHLWIESQLNALYIKSVSKPLNNFKSKH